MKKVYISGQITDNDNYINEFKNAETELKKKGYIPINPVENEGMEYRDYIDISLAKLSKADSIYMLSSWTKSKGARLEFDYAITVGLEVMMQEFNIKKLVPNPENDFTKEMPKIEKTNRSIFN